MKPLRLGLIGLDTSHVEGFAGILNDASNPDHLPNAPIVAAFPGGSPDFPLSIDRVPGFTQKLRDRYGVSILPTPRAVAEAVDAVLLTAVDGRVHLSIFEQIAAFRKPVFIDKPLATTTGDARAIFELAAKFGTPVFSSSSLGFAGALCEALGGLAPSEVALADFHGPLSFQPTQPGFFWYGIHTAEMLFATLGIGCATVRVARDANAEIVIGTWSDGRVGITRGHLAGGGFGGTIHGVAGSRAVDASVGRTPTLGLLDAILKFFQGGAAPVPAERTLELIRFLEAANESRAKNGAPIAL